jgi:two-component system chemotaxis sensor kinase CheA
VRLLSYLVLPREITDFERSYLRRLNRIALIFFYLHVPAFVGIAALAGTSMVQAAVFTPIVLIGPTIVYLKVTHPRAVAIACGFTAMVMGGLLVHFGQGPMQIEMHFYFFVLIALLAVFGNPIAILTAAVTVAVHHLVMWLVVPTSVFNYEASLWTVVVHAIFVVLESVAAVFVARSFFDNVIGLEKIVSSRTRELDRRNRDMGLVLDNVGQGFVTVDADGVMSAERSAILATWLGAAPASGKLTDYVAAADESVAAQLELALGEVFGGFLPLDLNLEQLPKRLEAAGHHLRFDYRPIGSGEQPDALLVVVSDITAELEREAAEGQRRELVAMFERLGADRDGFIEFCAEAEELVRQIGAGTGSTGELARQLHTLKGNAAIFGVESVASYCHALEQQLIDDGGPLGDAERQGLVDRWRTLTARLDALLGSRDVRRIEISDDDVQRVLLALRHNEPTADIHKIVAAWRLEPVARRFERVAEQANRLARRMGKALRVEVDDHGVRLDPAKWAPFWSSFVHAVRNAVDHGVETTDERKGAGKPETACLALRSQIADGQLTIEIRDDGRGVDWDRIRDRARKLGLPGDTRDQLIEALFADGVSTKEEVTDLSGRGVGMAALRAAAVAGGGRIVVDSDPSRGTSIRFAFPLDRLGELGSAPLPRRSTHPPYRHTVDMA